MLVFMRFSCVVVCPVISASGGARPAFSAETADAIAAGFRLHFSNDFARKKVDHFVVSPERKL